VLIFKNISSSSISLFVLNRLMNKYRRNSNVDLSNSPNETFLKQRESEREVKEKRKNKEDLILLLKLIKTLIFVLLNGNKKRQNS
jgi:hypothetical protein